MTTVIVTCRNCVEDYQIPIEDITVVVGYRTQTIVMARNYSFCCKECGFRNLNNITPEGYLKLRQHNVQQIHWTMPDEPPPIDVTTPLTLAEINEWYQSIDPDIESVIELPVI